MLLDAQGGTSTLKSPEDFIKTGSEVFLVATPPLPLHWFQYRRAIGLEAFWTAGN